MEELQKINIIYEDNHLLVVEKPVNIPVCEDSSHDLDLLTMLKKYIKDKYNKPGNVYLGLVHRLDRPVGGIMVFARTSKASSRLSKQIQEHKMDKIYYAVINGKIDSEGEMFDYLYKDKKNNQSYVTDKDIGKEAKLRYRRIDYNEELNYSLVEIFLYTGRSHQIRVQFASRGYPLVGDQKYGKDRDNKTNIALYSHKLVFNHPVTKERLEFNLDIPKRYPFDLF
ncbi:MAG: RluA family pseudouridine synthase [Bacilli bacterium]|nr:RluA family pseudouridine synthase [Bacilli bacterium]